MKIPALSLVLLFAFSFTFLEACPKNFKRSEELANFTIQCFTKVGFATVPSLDEMLKPNFNDKCAGKCIVRAMEVIDETGRVDKDALSDYLQENVDDQKLLKLNEMATSCVDSSGSDKVVGTKVGSSSNECKAIGKFYTCFVSAAEKLC